MEKIVQIYGAGLAGSEAAWQLAKHGIKVKLYDMKPLKYSPAHKNAKFAELVCSNSLRSDDYEHNAVGLMHEEMRRFGSLIMQCADKCRVPAGGALAVDREGFDAMVTEYLQANQNIEKYRALLEKKFNTMDQLISQINQQYSSFLTS